MPARHVLSLSLSLLVCATALPGQKGRAYSTGRFALEIDGKMAGFVSEFTGGSPTSTVVTEKLGPDMITRKHIAGVKYEPIVFDGAIDLAETALQMLLDNKIRRVNGAVITADYSLKEVDRLNFFQALVTAVTIPELNGSIKDACHFDIELQAEYTRTAKPDGGTLKSDAGKTAVTKCLPSNFRVTIDNLPTTRVAKIDAFTLRRTIVENAVGEMRDYQKQPARLEFPNLKLTIGEVDIKDWAAWADDFIVKGNNGQDKEKTLTLEILSPNLKDVLLTLTASGVGIVAVRPVPSAAGSENIRRSEVELYVENWTLGPAKRASLDGGPRQGALRAVTRLVRN
ncbi:MAG: phage tail protein [Gemmatimonadota bacterium]|nr:phage tail protein [Gemmatimonadota bacterium]